MKKLKRHMNYLTKTLLFAGVLAVVAGCGNSQKKVQEGNAEAAPAPVQATRVTVTSAVMQDVPQTETYASSVEAYAVNNIVPQGGSRIQKMNVDVGDFVSRGQVLAVMDRLNLEQARMKLVNDSTEYARIKGLFEEGGVSQSDFEAMELGKLFETKGLTRDSKLLALQYYCSEYREDIKGGTYTVTETIVPSASITINGNGATIDASGLTNHFIKMSKTPSDEYKVESGQYIVNTPSKIENVTITGLTKALFYDSGTQYVFKDFTFNNCLINYSEQGSLIISLAASMVINFTITNSTFYCKDKAKCTANCIAMSGKRPWQVTGFEDKEGKLLVDHNTFYNVAYKKQFFNTNTLKGQNKYKYEFNSNIFVNVSNKKIYYNLTNNKNQLTTDGKNTYLWDGEFFSETNYNGDEGLKSDPLFKDVENGDFTLDRSSLQYKNNTGDPLWFNPKVTINDNQTEASFDMPTSDVDFNYELVRDMSVQMTTTMGDGTEGVRYRVKKNEQNPGKYEPADMDMMQVLTLVAVNDGIEQKALTLNQDYYCRIYKLDEQTLQPEGDGVELFDFDFAPGLYALKAFAKDGSDYAGETALSNTFQLFQGYEITVPAGEYATFYKDENLYTEDEDAELYTIASVTDTEAVLSSQINKVAAYTPMLIFNKGTEANTFLLIPTTEQADEVTPAEEFKGSLTEGEIPASSAVTDYYALNGKAFVWVKDAIEIGANKCWLQIGDQPAAHHRRRRHHQYG